MQLLPQILTLTNLGPTVYYDGLNYNMVHYVQLNNCDTHKALYQEAEDAEEKSNTIWDAVQHTHKEKELKQENPSCDNGTKRP